MSIRFLPSAAALIAAFSFLSTKSANAHVKWFSDFRFEETPHNFAELTSGAFWPLFALSVVTLALLVLADRALQKWHRHERWNRWLESHSEQANVLLRVFTGASLLLAWQTDAVIAPELKMPAFWGWYQFGLALLLLGRRSSSWAGAGMIALYLVAMTQFGFFHLLDYVVYPATGYFLLVTNARNPRLYHTRIPALYLGLGFSLCWVSLEKMFYPSWGLEVLQQAPALTMGLDPQFFLLACAFIEFCLGYLLIIGLLERPLALTITLTFFTTTAFFGKTEVIGHTLLHGALLVFIILGTGNYYRPPIALHRSTALRAAFASVNFIIVFALLAFPYRYLAERNAAAHDSPSIQQKTSAPAAPETE